MKDMKQNLEIDISTDSLMELKEINYLMSSWSDKFSKILNEVQVEKYNNAKFSWDRLYYLLATDERYIFERTEEQIKYNRARIGMKELMPDDYLGRNFR